MRKFTQHNQNAVAKKNPLKGGLSLTRLADIMRSERVRFALLLGMVVFAVQLAYCFLVAPPQMGWWQYYGWRVAEGEVLYKDLYCFLQPYYVWLSAFLYRIFGANYVWYTALGVIVRTVAIITVYRLISQKITPLNAFFAAIAGFAVSISYLMDMAFDYNTVIIYLLIFTASALARAFGARGKSRALWFGVVGMLSGIHFMMKQSSGLVVPFATGVLILLLTGKELGLKRAALDIAFMGVGAIATIAPGYIALAAQGAMPYYKQCLFGSVGAKMGNGLIGIIRRYFTEMFRADEVYFAVFAFLAALFAYEGRALAERSAFSLSEQIGKARKQRGVRIAFVAALALSLGFFILYLEDGSQTLYEAILSALKKLSKLLQGGPSGGGSGSLAWQVWLGVSSCGAATVACSLLLCREKSARRRTGYYLLIACSLSLMLWMVQAADYQILNKLYTTKFAQLMRRYLVNVSFYFSLLFLLWEAVRYLISGKLRFGRTYFVYAVVMLALNATMLLSSVLEELSATVTAVVFFTAIFAAGEEEKPLLFARKAALSRTASAIKNGAIIATCSLVLCVGLIAKLCVPYSWHGWHVMPADGSRFSHVSSQIGGLKGFTLYEEDEEAYAHILSLIETYTEEGDGVFQFPNVPMFNLLSQRVIPTYAPITYWDVCPDHIAEQAAEELWNSPPKMIIWANLSEELWLLHEKYFRNGEKSGQRAILHFYEAYVQSHYEKKFAYDGRAGTGVIEVWVKTAP
ncbi:MAG: glycosyltransferase family 39 protein [Clostridia bacterium]|nr:glycosyltransferase family 39 protein [Clostridia bacterium]